ncbi:unnamed protein product [Rotaria socialis]|uniref:CxC5 like cysteine cluster associated with KDZ domain-containing protein n=1 Tax=Rotaria socialis TaxID=392032 RepID=A0A817Z9G8_9BILA|nr:unnamed protein product [Rotaria socialis]CAF4574711.1 unnamed protein product [Rotaria socialis]
MSDSNNLFEILASCIGPAPLPYVCRMYMDLSIIPSSILSSDLRTRTIQKAVNERFKSQFTIGQIRILTNLIAMNIHFVRNIFLMDDLSYINLSVKIYHSTIDILHDLLLLPFTNTCIYCQQILTFYDTKMIHVIDYSKNMEAMTVMMECKSCNLIYGHSSFVSVKNRRRYINQHSINSPKKIFYLCDSLGFTTSVLYDYTCQLMNHQSPFNAFIHTVLDRISYEQSDVSHCLEHIYLTKVFQSYWFLYNIVWFEFMLGKGTMVSIPDSLNRSELEQYIENSSGWWYHLFSIFWSRHKVLPNIKCNTINCSKCIIVDGHQKSKRLVCEYKNVVDTTIDEMTSIEIGCPYTPCRKTKANDSILTNFCRYHQPSNNLFPSSEMQKACQLAVEYAQRDQQSLEDHKTQCSNYRDDSEQIRKSRTFGFLASYHPCGVSIGFVEAIKAEGMRSITRHLLRSIIHGCQMPDALLYDCACTLKLHWQKWIGTDMLKLTNITRQLPRYIALDNFHQRTHTRSICQTVMKMDHPSHEGRFLGVNSQAAEIGFQFIAKAKYSLRNFSFPYSTVMLMLMLHLKNCRIVGINEYQIGLSSLYFSNEIKDYFLTRRVCETFGTFDKDDENTEEFDVIEDYNELTTEE